VTDVRCIVDVVDRRGQIEGVLCCGHVLHSRVLCNLIIPVSKVATTGRNGS
jgi:hypothetical protein